MANNNKTVTFKSCTEAQAIHFGNDDPRVILKAGETYNVIDTDIYAYHTVYTIEIGNVKFKFNSVCFEEWIEKDEKREAQGRESKRIVLPEKLKTTIVDEKEVFLVRIRTDPETTKTGIANIIPTGVSREERDYTISICNKLVESWNKNQE